MTPDQIAQHVRVERVDKSRLVHLEDAEDEERRSSGGSRLAPLRDTSAKCQSMIRAPQTVLSLLQRITSSNAPASLTLRSLSQIPAAHDEKGQHEEDVQRRALA